jgi:hypothetical protein
MNKNIKGQIESVKESLVKLKEVKEYVRLNFEAKASECDYVLDTIAGVCDRKESELLRLKGEALQNI